MKNFLKTAVALTVIVLYLAGTGCSNNAESVETDKSKVLENTLSYMGLSEKKKMCAYEDDYAYAYVYLDNSSEFFTDIIVFKNPKNFYYYKWNVSSEKRIKYYVTLFKDIARINLKEHKVVTQTPQAYMDETVLGLIHDLTYLGIETIESSDGLKEVFLETPMSIHFNYGGSSSTNIYISDETAGYNFIDEITNSDWTNYHWYSDIYNKVEFYGENYSDIIDGSIDSKYFTTSYYDKHARW